MQPMPGPNALWVMLPNQLLNASLYPVLCHTQMLGVRLLYMPSCHLIIFHSNYRVSTGTSVDGRPIGFNSSPFPLSARFRPVSEKW